MNVISRGNLWQRYINVPKLIDVGYIRVEPMYRRNAFIASHNLPNSYDGFRPMSPVDVFQVMGLINGFLQKFDASFQYTMREVEHWFLPKPEINYTYVFVGKGNVITDLVSFVGNDLSVPESSDLSSPEPNRPSKIKRAHSVISVANSFGFKNLLVKALGLAKREGFDLFSITDHSKSDEILKDLKFFCKGEVPIYGTIDGKWRTSFFPVVNVA